MSNLNCMHTCTHVVHVHVYGEHDKSGDNRSIYLAVGSTPIRYLYHVHVCISVPPTKHYSFQCNIYNLQCFYEVFCIFKEK